MKYILNYTNHTTFLNNMPSLIPNIAYDKEHIHYNEAYDNVEFDLFFNVDSSAPINIIDPDTNEIIYQIYTNHAGPVYLNLNKTYIFRNTGNTTTTNEYHRPCYWVVNLIDYITIIQDYGCIGILNDNFIEYNIKYCLKIIGGNSDEHDYTPYAWSALCITDYEKSNTVFQDCLIGGISSFMSFTISNLILAQQRINNINNQMLNYAINNNKSKCLKFFIRDTNKLDCGIIYTSDPETLIINYDYVGEYGTTDPADILSSDDNSGCITMGNDYLLGCDIPDIWVSI